MLSGSPPRWRDSAFAADSPSAAFWANANQPSPRVVTARDASPTQREALRGDCTLVVLSELRCLLWPGLLLLWPGLPTGPRFGPQVSLLRDFWRPSVGAGGPVRRPGHNGGPQRVPYFAPVSSAIRRKYSA